VSSLKQIFNKVDREVVADVQRVHVGAQVYRFLRVALFAFLASLPVHTGNLGWSALAALGAGALETAFRQLYPAFPLDKATSVVTHAIKEQATALATAAINAHVENYQASQATQAAVTAMLAQAGKSGQPVAAAPDATPPATT
jgi:hypothetical protein